MHAVQHAVGREVNDSILRQFRAHGRLPAGLEIQGLQRLSGGHGGHNRLGFLPAERKSWQAKLAFR